MGVGSVMVLAASFYCSSSNIAIYNAIIVSTAYCYIGGSIYWTLLRFFTGSSTFSNRITQ